MIDRRRFDDTFKYYDKDVIFNIIGLFEKELPARLEKIQMNIQEMDFEAIEFNVHSLKSITGTFMATEFAELMRTLEEMARHKRPLGLSELFEKLKIASYELVKELNEIKSELT
jgi:HPt (histidine-containing phosphotransfer) domain-containing protein